MKNNKENIYRIGKIDNHEGCLLVKKVGLKHYWGIGDYNGVRWEHITKKWYTALVDFEKHRTKTEELPSYK